MKSYNVKSNAKRFARGLAAKFPGRLEAVEPVAVEDGAREWYPAIRVLGEWSADEWIVLRGYPFDAAVIQGLGEDGEEVAQTPTVIKAASAGKTDTATIAAALPPPVQSTKDEIAARRAERRQRIEAEKANPPPATEKRADTIIRLVSQPDGATVAELCAATTFQPHTLRGYIAGTLRKRLAPIGKTIDTIKAKDQPTRYTLRNLNRA